MITFAITSLVAFTLVAFFALARALKHAPEGYEDNAGFHHGITPRPQIATLQPLYTDHKHAA
jgi:hypothetical protein